MVAAPYAGALQAPGGVAPAGVEPAISALRGLRPRPLDDGATSGGRRWGRTNELSRVRRTLFHKATRPPTWDSQFYPPSYDPHLDGDSAGPATLRRVQAGHCSPQSGR